MRIRKSLIIALQIFVFMAHEAHAKDKDDDDNQRGRRDSNEERHQPQRQDDQAPQRQQNQQAQQQIQQQSQQAQQQKEQQRQQQNQQVQQQREQQRQQLQQQRLQQHQQIQEQRLQQHQQETLRQQAQQQQSEQLRQQSIQERERQRDQTQRWNDQSQQLQQSEQQRQELQRQRDLQKQREQQLWQQQRQQQQLQQRPQGIQQPRASVQLPLEQQHKDWKERENFRSPSRQVPSYAFPDQQGEDKRSREWQQRRNWTKDRQNIDGDRSRSYLRDDGRFSNNITRQKESQWNNRGRNIRQDYREDRKDRHIFDDDYWYRFRGRNSNWDFNNNFPWYQYPSWNYVNGWLPYGWNQPIYYDFSSGGYYIDNSTSAYFIPPSAYGQYGINAYDLANSYRIVSRIQDNWMPLGTFAIAAVTESQSLAQEYISLAISKDGAVTGAYVNINDNIPLQIEGAIDDASQRIAIKFVGFEWPIMEMGIYNLTREESSMLVYFSPNQTDIRLLIRLEE